MTVMQPRYPGARVHLRSASPLVMISAVRTALRQAGAPRDEIRLFSDRAFETGDPGRILEICREWAAIEMARGAFDPGPSGER